MEKFSHRIKRSALFCFLCVGTFACGADDLMTDDRGYTIDSPLWTSFSVALREHSDVPWALLDADGDANLAVPVTTVWTVDQHGLATLTDEHSQNGATTREVLRERTLTAPAFTAFKNQLASFHFMAWPAGNYCEQAGILCSNEVTMLTLHMDLNGTVKHFTWPAQTAGVPDELNAMAQCIKDAI